MRPCESARTLATVAIFAFGSFAVAGEAVVCESARAIPLAYDVDVLVVGGTTGAVSAAVGAAESGASVFLAAPRPYLGDDMVATFRLFADRSFGDGEVPLDTPLARKIFGDAASSMLRPMHVKKVLDDALLEAGVPFLYGCFPTDVLRDAEGNPCGIVMANRSGRQAVVAKTIVDATDWAVVARMAGAEYRPGPSAARTFKRIVVGGEIQTDPRVEHRVVGTIQAAGGRGAGAYPVVEYTFDLEVDRPTASALAEVQQWARDATYQPGQVRASEKLFYVPWTSIVSKAGATEGSGFEGPALDAFRPADVPRVFVLGACADVPRDDARRLLSAPVMIKLGARIGEAAAEEAAALPAPQRPCLPAESAVEAETDDAPGDVREVLLGVRPTRSMPTLPAGPRRVPVLGNYDVVVIGGGTSGAPAGIAAARQGAKVLVVEYQEGLGGIGTLGLIGNPHRGKNIGFTREVPFPGKNASGGIEHKMEWYRREIRKAGGEIWLGALGCGAVVDGNRVRGAVVVPSEGRSEERRVGKECRSRRSPYHL